MFNEREILEKHDFRKKSSLPKENFIHLPDLLLPPDVRYKREQRIIDYSKKYA